MSRHHAFNQVYGSFDHEEDHHQNSYHNDHRHYDNSSMQYPHMPQGYRNPPNQGMVNIGFASGNVNTGTVHGSLTQSEGVRRTAAPQPLHPAPAFLSRGSPPALDHVPRSQRQVGYQPDHMYEEQRDPPFPQPFFAQDRHSDDHAYTYEPKQHHQPSHHRSYLPQDQSSHYEHSPHSHHERPYYNDSPPRAPPREPRGEPRVQYSPESHPQDSFHPFVQSPTSSEGSFPPRPPLKPDNNPFRRKMTVDTTSPFTAHPRPSTQRKKAATLSGYPIQTSDYTSNWVAGHASQSDTSPPPSRDWHGSTPEEEEGQEFQYNLSTPSESSASSVPPEGYWSRTYSRTSSATTYTRFSPVPEESGLRVDTKSSTKSRSPTPDLK